VTWRPWWRRSKLFRAVARFDNKLAQASRRKAQPSLKSGALKPHSLRPCKALCVAGGGVLPIPATLGVPCASSGSCAAAIGVVASTGSALVGFRLIAPDPITHTVQASRSSRPIAPPASVLREGTARRRHRATHSGAPRRGLAGLDGWLCCWRRPGGPRLGNPWLRPRREATAAPAATPAPSRRRVPTGVPSASTRASPWPPVAFPGLQATEPWRPRTALGGGPWRPSPASSVTPAPASGIKALAKRRRMCGNLATRWRLHVGKPPWSGEEAAAEMGHFPP
jgi:hypothetical protein